MIEGEVTVLVRVDELDPHLLQPVVHMGIVNDLPHQEDLLVGEFVPGLVGVVHGPIHPVAEAEFLGQPDRHVTECLGVTLGTG